MWKIFVGKGDEKHHSEDLSTGGNIVLIMDLRETGLEDLERIHVA